LKKINIVSFSEQINLNKGAMSLTPALKCFGDWGRSRRRRWSVKYSTIFKNIFSKYSFVFNIYFQIFSNIFWIVECCCIIWEVFLDLSC